MDSPLPEKQGEMSHWDNAEHWDELSRKGPFFIQPEFHSHGISFLIYTNLVQQKTPSFVEKSVLMMLKYPKKASATFIT